MLGNARTAMKFLVYGLVIGLLFAPRSGKETRSELIDWLGDSATGLFKNVTGSSSN